MKNRIGILLRVLGLASLLGFTAVSARAHVSGPQLLEGNVDDTLVYYIVSDVTEENLPSFFFIGAPYNTNSIYVTPDYAFDNIYEGIWHIECIAPGTQTVTFAWSYTHADNTVSNGTFAVEVTVHPRGTVKKSASNYPFSAEDSDPVNLFTGELIMEEAPDLELGGPFPLRFMRYHASGLARDTLVRSALGLNWSHNFDWRALRASNHVDVVTWQGRRIRFQRVAGAWQLADQPTITPFQLVDSGFNLIFGDPRDQRLYTFDTNGLLRAISDGRGNTHTLSYNGGLLQQVADGLGRTLTFTDTGFARLSTVSDGQRNISFLFGSYLALVIDALGYVTTYDYDLGNSIAALLTAKTRPRGNVPFSQTYDSRGRVATQTDRNTYLTTFLYDGNDTSFTDPRGNIRSYTHSASGALLSYTDEGGQAISLSQNANGQRAVVTDRLGNTTGIAYHAPSGKPAAITNADGTVTSFLFTNHVASGITFYEPAQVTYPDGMTERFTYDTRGNVLTRTDRAGLVWTFTYNSRSQVLTALNPTGGTTTYTYDASGNPASRSDSDTGTTTFAYDQFSRLTNIVHPDSTTMRMAWDANDRLTSTTDERGNTIAFSYDANDNLVGVTDALGRMRGLAYDGRDRMIRSTNRLGQVSSRGFGPLDQLLAVTNRNGNVTTFSYDARRRQTSVTDPGGRIWSMGHDNEAIPISFTNPLNQTSRTGTDQLGYPVTATNALGHVTRLVRDALRRVTATVDAIARTNQFSYEARGSLASATAPLIGTASYQRNNLGQLSGITDLNGRQWGFGYTAMGRLQSLTDPLNRRSLFDYDTRGRGRKTTFADGVTRTNSYDAASNLTRAQHSSGPDLQYSYDALDRLVTANNLAFTYDAEGRVTNTTSSGVSFGAAYDPGGRLTNVTYLNGALTIRYTYDSRDRPTRVQDSLTAARMDFSYDEAGRLTGMTRANGVNGTYTYDAAGRLTRITEGGIIDLQYTLNAAAEVTAANFTAPLDPGRFTNPIVGTFVYDAAHQVKGVGFAYDARGRQTTAPGHGFAWDGASRLVGIDGVTLGYNGVNDIVTRAAGGVTTRYFYNHALGLNPIVAEKNETSGQVLRYYVWSPGGRLLYLIDAQNGNAVSYFHFDRVGSTLALTAGNGTVTDAYAYSPYGVLLGHAGTSAQPFTYIGAFGVRAEGNLCHMRARYYDPARARFLSRDPLWPRLGETRTLDPYEYALLNPFTNIDPQGTDELPLLDRLIHALGLGTPGPLREDTAQEKASRAREADFRQFREKADAGDREFDRLRELREREERARKDSSRAEESRPERRGWPSWGLGYAEGSKAYEDNQAREKAFEKELAKRLAVGVTADTTSWDEFKKKFNRPIGSGKPDAPAAGSDGMEEKRVVLE